MSIVQLVISMLLFFVLFYGISFLLNMILKVTWLMVGIYPFIVLMIVDGISTADYFTATKEAFSTLGTKLVNLYTADILMLLSGLVGTILAGMTIRYLRKAGYQMF
ncbi:YuiB family protein [Salinicoccus halodurans]|uniref:Membrane protein n=1 Tax=Salinicoccus halodurans TaxID=407035 RepID=A0A0F7HJP8_9STAP|nr:YuiB family protein [Salinicoccus halodurans]AKG73299.1 membrane protein [Salinicoccus halodurans]SFK82727.1 Putative membrane protein [Salinicoccus halodurans]